ncbi:MAG: hypothetical protein HRT68_07290 [Flavobacteriaceae bacterium]|nr:hypothetical protein [Flavobacteriaceae bacterium]
MPIEIKELYIKINVDESKTSSGKSTKETGSSDDKSDIVAVCVEEVMELLKQQKER